MAQDNKFNRKSDKSNWLLNLDKIQDSTMKNYFSDLPEEKRIQQFFSEAFVINKPKGRVSGNGFWLHNHGDDAYLALFSCVGEGHLAHMMIRIYKDALKKMVDSYSIDYTGGANMNLIQVTHSDVRFINGDEHQVGEKAEQVLAYSSIKLEETKESDFYLCSSGVFNLIGGPSFKRLSVKEMGEFLKEKFSSPMHKKKALLEEFLIDWTGASQQNDDIMVLGFGA